MASGQHERDLAVVKQAVDSLQDGTVKRHMAAALQSLQETLRSLHVGTNLSSAAGVNAAPRNPNSFPERLASKLGSTDAAAVSSPHYALMVCVHALLLDSGLTCTGVSDAPDATGFARPLRATENFLPKDWAAQGGTAFNLRYSYPPPGTTSSLTSVLLTAMSVGPLLSVSVRASGGGAAAGGSPRSASCELDTGRFCAQGAQGAGLASLLSPLCSDERHSELRGLVRTRLVYPVVPPLDPNFTQGNPTAGKQTHRDGMAAMPHYPNSTLPGREYPSQGGYGGGGLSVPQPRTGIPGDFDRDLYPDMTGGIPGGLLGTGRGGRGGGGYGGMGVGPDHPIFGHPAGVVPGLHPDGIGPGGGLPPGVPPGARFDPFGPPGTGVGIPNGPRGPAIGGSRGPAGFFGPNPDHLRPPADGDDMGPPPDMYW